MSIEQVQAQLTDEVDVALIGGVRDLLGLDLADLCSTRLDTRAGMLTAQLCGDDDRLSRGTATDLMLTLWGQAEPDPPWWRTPLGRACARALAHDSSDAVTVSTAAAMLGIAPSTVSVMLHRASTGQGGSGGLERHPDGGVTRASVLARIART